MAAGRMLLVTIISLRRRPVGVGLLVEEEKDLNP